MTETKFSTESDERERMRLIVQQAIATAASIRTRCGQISSALKMAPTNAVAAFDRIDHAKGALETAALDLENILRHASGEAAP